MVHYIRFLRVPQVRLEDKGRLQSISSVLNVTTDLGEAYYPDDLELLVRLVNIQHPRATIGSWRVFWRKDARVVKLHVHHRSHASSNLVRLHVSTRETDDSIVKRQMPKVVDAWSSSFHLNGNCAAEDLVERELHLTDETCVKIWEETGESIARHIWDGAVGCLELYKHLLRPGDTPVPMPKLHELLIGQRRKYINVVELGSGCGVAGIGLAQIVPGSKVLLTDLEEAQEILTKNIHSSSLLERSSLKQEVLDWDKPLFMNKDYESVDLLIVCECIYNADSDPALVNVLQQFIKSSPEVKILVIMKRRHWSETVFFDLIADVGIGVIERCFIPLPHHASEADMEAPQAEVYLYGATKSTSSKKQNYETTMEQDLKKNLPSARPTKRSQFDSSGDADAAIRRSG